MATATQILEKAKSYIGTKENPANSNNVIFNTNYYGRSVSGASYPWCAVFIWDIFRMCNASHLFYGGKKSAYTPTIAQYYKDNKQWHSSPAIGDLVFYQWSSYTRICHMGIVESVNSNGTITVIEGNTSVGNDTNGGSVMRRTRPTTYVRGYGRPTYEKSTSSKPTISNPASPKKGLDVSSYQGSIDWKKVAADHYSFAILRGVIKNGSLDNTFFSNYKSAKENGLDLSCYQFSYALTEQEAVNAANNMIAKLNGIRLPIWLDLEWDTQGKLGKTVVTNIAKAYVATCLKSGYDCHIYSNLDWYKNKYDPTALQELGCQFWIARYANSGEYKESLKPNIGEAMWQWTSKGTVNGITGAVDLNIMYEPIRSNLDSNTISTPNKTMLARINNCSALNMRSQPDSSKQNVVTIIKPSDTIIISTEQNGWYYATLSNGTAGWVSAKYIKLI